MKLNSLKQRSTSFRNGLHTPSLLGAAQTLHVDNMRGDREKGLSPHDEVSKLAADRQIVLPHADKSRSLRSLQGCAVTLLGCFTKGVQPARYPSYHYRAIWRQHLGRNKPRRTTVTH